MADLSTLSVKEKLDERMRIYEKMKSITDAAGGADKLSGEATAEWEKLDADIEKLNGLIDAHRSVDAKKQRLSALDEKLKENPGRQTEPTNPGSTGAEPSSFQLRGQKLNLDADPRLKALATPEYEAKFENFLMNRGKPEQLGMQVGSDPKGGYLAPIGFVRDLLKFVDDMVWMRQMGTIYPTNGAVSLGVVSWDTDPGDADWTPEVPASDISEDDAARVGRRELTPHGLSKLVKLSQKLQRSSILPIAQLLISRMGYKFAITCEKAYLTGDGVQKPLGVFTASADGVSTARDVETGTSVDFTFDDAINMFYSLKAPYASRATWLASREWFKRARKLKSSATGDYLWQPAPALGAPDTILTRPYKVSEFCPGQTSAAWTAGVYTAILGDFSYYWIADSLQLEIQVLNELFTLKNQVGFKGWLETDGQPVMAEAFSRMKLKT